MELCAAANHAEMPSLSAAQKKGDRMRGAIQDGESAHS
jgi:hypothetical protein